MKPTVTHIVNIFFDYDRETLLLDPQWIKDRFNLFHATTLRSLLGQTFQDFRIWVYCGQRNKPLTQSLDWHPRVERIYDEGQAAMKTVDTNFVALTRIDSDDLMHREAMADVRREMLYDATRRRVLIFKRNLVWDQNNEFIGYHYRSAPPFFTHIFPWTIYQNFKEYHDQHFVVHGKSGARDSANVVELPKHRICVVKHRSNISDIRRDRHPGILNTDVMSQLRKAGDIHAEGKEAINRVLEEFSQ